MSEGQDRAPSGILWWFLVGLAAVTVLFYRDFIFDPGRILAGSDMVLEGIPLRKFFVEEILAGRGVPLWTPHVYAGMPYVGLLPGPIFYPTTALYFLMPLGRAIGWTFVIHTFLGGAFAYFLARSFNLRRWSAVVCGASFVLSGYVTSHLFGGQDGRIFAMTLFPLALGMLERALRSGDPRWYCGLALTVALQIFTPHMQVVYFSSLALSLYLVFHLVVRVRSRTARSGNDRGRGWVAYAKPAAGFGLAFLAAAGLGAIQLFPTFALLEHVTRAAPEQAYTFAASWALPAQEVSAFFLPDLIGSYQTYWGANGIKLHTEYLGAVPIALAILAGAASFRSALRREQRHAIWFLWAASTLGVLFALGAATPVHRVAYTVLPMISSFRAPSMMLGPVVVFIALLAGFGWDSVLAGREAAGREGEEEGPGFPASWLTLGLLGAPVLLMALIAALSPEGLQRFAELSWYPSGWPRRPPAELATSLRTGGGFLLAGFALAWGVGYGVASRRLGEFAVVAVVLFGVADAWRIASRYVPTQDAEDVVAVADDTVLATLREDAGPGDRVWACGFRCGFNTYRANRFMSEGVSSATGDQKFLLKSYARLLGGFQPDEGLLQYPSLIPLLGVRYVIWGVPQPGLELLAQEPGKHLYRIPKPPHAYFPDVVRTIQDSTEALAQVRINPDPQMVAIVEPSGGRSAPAAGQGTASIVEYAPERIEIEVQAEMGGLLVVSEMDHPYWHAYVDDVETEIWRTDIALRGIEVPTGSHRVRFEYRSPAFRAGGWTSAASGALLLAVVTGSFRRRRRANRDPSAGAHDG